ncbi:MAG: outer membrane protein assembly factor BamD [Syntrophobacteraceae bacterium]|nr:outer membrane protein assembly factor BamD [Syntrophobacteraceae bacterium]
MFSFNFMIRLQRLFRVFVLVSAVLATGGCGTNLREFYFGDLFGKTSSTVNKNAAQLAQEGMQKMREKKYGDALEAFKQIKEHYPYSKYAILAELKIGDAHFQRREYSEAAIAYEEFARLHPRNEVVPYVLYQIGMCHFLSFSTVERDQEETRLAVEAFQRLVQTFPESEYARKAKKQLFECKKRIVAHDYNVGRFYYRQGEYRAAKERLQKMVMTYPDAVKELGYLDSVNEILEVCEKEISKGEKKPSIWTRLGL